MATTIRSGTRVLTTQREAALADEVLTQLDGEEGVLVVERQGNSLQRSRLRSD